MSHLCAFSAFNAAHSMHVDAVFPSWCVVAQSIFLNGMFSSGLALPSMVTYSMCGFLPLIAVGLGWRGLLLSWLSSGRRAGCFPHASRHVFMKALHASSGSCLNLLKEQFEMASCLGYCASGP